MCQPQRLSPRVGAPWSLHVRSNLWSRERYMSVECARDTAQEFAGGVGRCLARRLRGDDAPSIRRRDERSHQTFGHGCAVGVRRAWHRGSRRRCAPWNKTQIVLFSSFSDFSFFSPNNEPAGDASSRMNRFLSSFAHQESGHVLLRSSRRGHGRGEAIFLFDDAVP